jgi:hypothetical protein
MAAKAYAAKFLIAWLRSVEDSGGDDGRGQQEDQRQDASHRNGVKQASEAGQVSRARPERRVRATARLWSG